MKKFILLVLVSNLMLAAETSIKLGVDGYRDTDINNSSDSNGIGATVGVDYIIRANNFGYGLGAEIRTEVNPDNTNDYFSHPVYLLGKYYIGESDYYLTGRVGFALNTGNSDLDKLGTYAAYGVGKSIGNFDVELLNEATQINNSGISKNLELFEDNLQTVSLKVAYVFGREKEAAPKIYEKLDLALSNNVEEKNIIWNYSLQGENPEIVKATINGNEVSLSNSGKYVSENLENGTYILKVEAKDINGNIVSKTSEATINVKAPIVEVVKEEPIIVAPVAEVIEEKPVVVTPKEEVVVQEPVIVKEEIIAQEPVVIKEEAKKTGEFSIIKGYDVYNTTVSEEQQKEIENVVSVINGKKGTLYVIGYTDDKGSEELNKRLSKERAEAAAVLLKEKLTNKEDIKIITLGKGEVNFKYPNTSEENRMKNRRVEFEFKGIDGEVISSKELTKY
jgi:outer membrane protein OmpA-like peptidoglycan-associated protein